MTRPRTRAPTGDIGRSLVFFTCEVCDVEYLDHPVVLPPHRCAECEDEAREAEGDL